MDQLNFFNQIEVNFEKVGSASIETGMKIESNQTAIAYDYLCKDLQACRVRPGERIPVSLICKELSVSPGSVREALSRLVAEGLVTAEQNRGFRAADLEIENFAHLTQARLAIDILCLRDAIAAGDVEWESNLIAACHRMERRLDELDGSPEADDRFAEAHAIFHKALVDGGRNPYLLRMHDLLYLQSTRYRQMCLPLAGDKPRIHAFQGEFMTAVISRDAERAVELLSEYYLTASDIVANALDKNEQSPTLVN